MIYTKIFKPGFKNPFKVTAMLILTIFSLSLNGCHTFKTEYYSPEELKSKDDDYTIKELQTKNDSLINLERTDIVNIEKPTKFSEYLNWSRIYIDTGYSKFAPEKEIMIPIKMKLDEIKKIKVETRKDDFVGTTLIISGITLVFIIIASIMVGMQQIY